MDAELLWVTGLGIVAILTGVVQLIRESRLLLDVFQAHIEELERR